MDIDDSEPGAEPESRQTPFGLLPTEMLASILSLLETRGFSDLINLAHTCHELFECVSTYLCTGAHAKEFYTLRFLYAIGISDAEIIRSLGKRFNNKQCKDYALEQLRSMRQPRLSWHHRTDFYIMPYTPLHSAAIRGSLDMVKFLIKYIEPNHPGQRTLLDVAISARQDRIVRYLINNGHTDHNSPPLGQNAMHTAAATDDGEHRIIRMLHKKNQHLIHGEDASGHTPISYAFMSQQHMRTINYLETHGPNLDERYLGEAIKLGMLNDVYRYLTKDRSPRNGGFIPSSDEKVDLFQIFYDKGDMDMMRYQLEAMCIPGDDCNPASVRECTEIFAQDGDDYDDESEQDENNKVYIDMDPICPKRAIGLIQSISFSVIEAPDQAKAFGQVFEKWPYLLEIVDCLSDRFPSYFKADVFPADMLRVIDEVRPHELLVDKNACCERFQKHPVLFGSSFRSFRSLE